MNETSTRGAMFEGDAPSHGHARTPFTTPEAKLQRSESNTVPVYEGPWGFLIAKKTAFLGCFTWFWVPCKERPIDLKASRNMHVLVDFVCGWCKMPKKCTQ